MNFTIDRYMGLPLELLRTLRTGSIAMLTTILICLVSLTTIATAQDSGDKPVDEMKIAIKSAELQQQLADPSICLLYTSPSPRDQRGSRMPSSA